MRKFLAALLVASAMVTYAAEPAPMVESLVGDGYWGFWIQPEAKLAGIESDSAGMVGGQLGISLNRALYVGYGYYRLASSVQVGDPKVGELGTSDLSYHGLDVNYTFMATKVVHGSADLFVGWGDATVDYTDGDSEGSDLFLVEPGMSLLVNVTPQVELGLGVGYQFVNGSDIDELSDSDLSGPAGRLFLRWTEER